MGKQRIGTLAPILTLTVGVNGLLPVERLSLFGFQDGTEKKDRDKREILEVAMGLLRQKHQDKTIMLGITQKD